jgi:hypothetical protein
MRRVTFQTLIWLALLALWLTFTAGVSQNAGDMMAFFTAQPLLSWSNQVLVDFYLTAFVVLGLMVPDARQRGIGVVGSVALVIATLGLGALMPLVYMIWRSLKPAKA